MPVKCFILGPRPDYYSALGISKAADVKQIKLAYFRMAKKYHPVRFPPIFFLISNLGPILFLLPFVNPLSQTENSVDKVAKRLDEMVVDLMAFHPNLAQGNGAYLNNLNTKYRLKLEII
jgi:hypothetical protein